MTERPEIQHEPRVHDAFVALGANVGDRRAAIGGALDHLADTPGVRITAVSDLIETQPVGPPGQGPYLNGACTLATSLAPRELLDALLAIERRLGRTRAGTRWGPRIIDLDLLLYGRLVIDEPGLTVPHPRMHERHFVLRPLAQIAPRALHPLLGRTVVELLAMLDAAPRSTPPVAPALLAIAVALGAASRDIGTAHAQPAGPLLRADAAPPDIDALPGVSLARLAESYRTSGGAERFEVIYRSGGSVRRAELEVAWHAAGQRGAGVSLNIALGEGFEIRADAERAILIHEATPWLARVEPVHDGDVPAALARLAPPLPLPHIGLLFADIADPLASLPLIGEVRWTDALIRLSDRPPTALVAGRAEGGAVRISCDAGWSTITSMTATLPGGGGTIELNRLASIAGRTLTPVRLSRRTLVDTAAELMPAEADLRAGLPAPGRLAAAHADAPPGSVTLVVVTRAGFSRAAGASPADDADRRAAGQAADLAELVRRRRPGRSVVALLPSRGAAPSTLERIGAGSRAAVVALGRDDHGAVTLRVVVPFTGDGPGEQTHDDAATLLLGVINSADQPTSSPRR